MKLQRYSVSELVHSGRLENSTLGALGVPHAGGGALGGSESWCCSNLVHIPKAGGTTIEKQFQRRSWDTITFHHSYSFFLQSDLLFRDQRRCFTGIALRHPVSRFISSYWYCLGRKCPRAKVGCGFLACENSSQLAEDYAQDHNMYVPLWLDLCPKPAAPFTVGKLRIIAFERWGYMDPRFLWTQTQINPYLSSACMAPRHHSCLPVEQS